MAKKKARKKHRLKYGQAVTAERPQAAGTAVEKVISSSPKVVIESEDFGYVQQDLRRVITLAIVLTGVELVLWLLFNHTHLGPAVYGLFKIS